MSASTTLTETSTIRTPKTLVKNNNVTPISVNKLSKNTNQQPNKLAQKQQQQQQQQQQSTNPLRLLIEKLVFLDINTSYKHLGKLKECLLTIGVNIADCMSKDVNYVITNRVKYEELKLIPTFGNELISDLSKINATPKKTSPTVAFSRTGAINRTQAILEKASKGNICGDILSSARRLGISIMHVIEIEKYVEKYMMKTKLLTNNPNKVNTSSIIIPNSNSSMSITHNTNKEIINSNNKQKLQDNELLQHIIEITNNNIRKLNSPYIKFESICKQYKPIFHEFKQWHDILFNSSTKNNHSPFQIYFSDELKGASSSTSTNNNEASKNKKTPTNTPTQQLNICSQSTTTTINGLNIDNNTKIGSNLSSSINNSQQQIVTKTPLLPRTNSTISNTSSIHQSLNRLTSTTITTTNRLSIMAQSKQQSPNHNTKDTIATALATKKKAGGYCECCKLRYDNLKQHLTSLQHENFEKNQLNFRELDVIINGTLNFDKFINKYRDKRKKEEKLIESKEEVAEKKDLVDDFHEKTLIDDNEIKTNEEIKASYIHENQKIDDEILIKNEDNNKIDEILVRNEDDNKKIENNIVTETIINVNENIVDNVDNKKKKKTKLDKDINRLIFESKSLGEKKGDRRRSNAVKYTELTNKDFKCLLNINDPITETILSVAPLPPQIETEFKLKPLSKTKKSLTVPNDLNEIANNGDKKSIKRKRKLTPDREIDDKKTKIKLKLERNRSNNNWQVSSSLALNDDLIERNEIDKKFDNALLELVKECENEDIENNNNKIINKNLIQTVINKQQKQPNDIIDDNKSKRAKIVKSPIKIEVQKPTPPPPPPSYIHPQQIAPTKPLFTIQQLNSLNSQLLAAKQISNFCIYMAPPPPLPPILPSMYCPAPFFIPPPRPPPPPFSSVITRQDPLLSKYTANMNNKANNHQNNIFFQQSQQQQQQQQQNYSTYQMFTNFNT